MVLADEQGIVLLWKRLFLMETGMLFWLQQDIALLEKQEVLLVHIQDVVLLENKKLVFRKKHDIALVE